MVAKVAAVAGTVLGWGTAGGLIFMDPQPRFILIQAFALCVGLAGTMWLLMACRNRPMGAAFELGYDMGKRDAMKAANRRKVTPIRFRLEGAGRERQVING